MGVMDFEDRDELINKLLQENQRLLIENNSLLKGMYRQALLSRVFKVVWFLIWFGALVYVYTMVIKPNYDNLKTKIDHLEEGMSAIGATLPSKEDAKGWLDGTIQYFSPPKVENNN